MKESKTILGLFILLLACFVGSSAAASEPKKINFGYSTIGAMATGGWMAKEIGAFDKYGIQADLIYIPQGRCSCRPSSAATSTAA